MASAAPPLPIVLYHYAYSPFARRVVWYLHLRRIPYAQCLQPPMLPRPDVAGLGIRYRRIPLLAIGRDVYLDSRLILRKLDQLYPPSPAHPRLAAAPAADATPEQRALERLLEICVVDAGLFTAAMRLLPPDLPLLQDPKFRADRADYVGGPSPSSSAASSTPADAAARRADAVHEIRTYMHLLETTLLADGRPWLCGGSSPSSSPPAPDPGPTLADIEAVWPLHWITGIPNALRPSDKVSADQFPRVYAWIARFQQAVSHAKAALPARPPTLDGPAARSRILAAPFAEAEGETSTPGVDAADPFAAQCGLRVGSRVTVGPTDTGTRHRDTGTLVRLSDDEVVFETEAGGPGGETLRVHAPRHGFSVRPAPDVAAAAAL